MVVFTPNTPQGPELPNFSQPLMEANNQYLQAFGNRDHQFTLDSGNMNDGTHKSVTFNDLAGSPGFAGASCVVYSKSVTPPAGTAFPQLFFDASSPSAPVQLTSHTPHTATIGGVTSGYSYVPGGVMIIWGYGTYGPNTSVPFPTDPNTSAALTLSAVPYSVVTTFTNTGSVGFATVSSTSTTGFTLVVRDRNGGNLTTTISWIAIGPA